MPAYPVRIMPFEGGGVMLRFPDVPEAVAVGDTPEDALRNAVPVLEAVLQSYVDEGRFPPDPGPVHDAPVVATELFAPGRWRPRIFAGRL